MGIRAVVVDDEPLARDGLRLMLETEADIELIGQCANGAEAIRFIKDKKPDLVFLDIEMPRIDGFAVIRALDPQSLPYVVFVTAYDEYAVEAFNVHAVDYLLKPVRKARLQESLNRLRERLKERDRRENSERLTQLLAQFNRLNGSESAAQSPGNQEEGRIVVKSHGHVYFLQARDIIWVEASGDYVTIHTPKKSHLLRETMRNMETRLDSHGFKRIHRSAIINLECVSELTSNRNNDYNVVLTDGTVLNLGRSYKDSLYASLGGIELE